MRTGRQSPGWGGRQIIHGPVAIVRHLGPLAVALGWKATGGSEKIPMF